MKFMTVGKDLMLLVTNNIEVMNIQVSLKLLYDFKLAASLWSLCCNNCPWLEFFLFASRK